MSAYAVNKKARFDFEILDTFEAGVVLSGPEVKSIRAGRAKLEGSYVVVRGGEAYWVGASIAPYQVANTPTSYDRERPRKLLLSQKELKELEQAEDARGLTVVPLKLYNSKRHIKLEIAIGRGKKKADKRETIKERDTKRDINRILKQSSE